MSYETTLVIAGFFLKFTTVKIKGPNKPLNNKKYVTSLKQGLIFFALSTLHFVLLGAEEQRGNKL